MAEKMRYVGGPADGIESPHEIDSEVERVRVKIGYAVGPSPWYYYERRGDAFHYVPGDLEDLWMPREDAHT